ncbi:potassium transporter 18 [Brachypodium distachyon]|uniref:Uncharacterized protein n=1 Tax=Brachypodium distachyon TaxID=15368 RepID=I1ITP4_BRADI|nr:potassium transporter 18 [Brachypodium distachyon]KQJ91904.1 hypothetical protein BRADI_4g40460v3 [Brachypodium distachyon]|eukprot:XP_010239475.1 potassium transporter 18 [Brachypodium distachyon]
MFRCGALWVQGHPQEGRRLRKDALRQPAALRPAGEHDGGLHVYTDSDDYNALADQQELNEVSSNVRSIAELSSYAGSCSGEQRWPGHVVGADDDGGSVTFKTVGDEVAFLNSCRDAGVVHILGNTVIRACRDSGLVKKIAINYLYAFLRKICRENSVIFNVPHESLLNVGHVFCV